VDYQFGKTYKLCSEKLIDQTYKKGKTIKEIPFILNYLAVKNTLPQAFQVVIVVPKRKFRHAVTRNQIKRYIREALRLHKSLIEQPLHSTNTELALFLLYVGRKEVTFHDIEKKIIVLLNRLAHEVNSNEHA
jgi:ribonuclease P protein component